MPNITVVACCSRDEENARRFAGRFSIPAYYTDYHELLAREKVDFLSITTYASSRCAIVCDAAAHGVKGIFCEKAMATSLDEADTMIRTCAEAGVVLSVNYTRRWADDFRKAKELIEEGALGTLQSMSGTFSGNLLHTGTHLLDAMIYFAGDPCTVWGTVIDAVQESSGRSGYMYADADEGCDDKDGIATINFANGCFGHVAGLGKKYFIFELDIQGTNGRIRIGNGLFELWRVRESTRYSAFRELYHDHTLSYGDGTPTYVRALTDLVHAVEKRTETACSGREARKSLECALAIYESHDAGGAAVTLPLTRTARKVVSR